LRLSHVLESGLKLINIIRKASTFLIRFYIVRMRGYYLIYDISTLSYRESIGILGNQNKLSKPDILQSIPSKKDYL
jgi:hypothetical protein